MSIEVLPISSKAIHRTDESRLVWDKSLSPVSPWVRLCRDFLSCHRRPINVACHAITTPIAILGLIECANEASPTLVPIAITVYSASLLFFVPRINWLATTCVLLAITWLSWMVSGGWGIGLTLFLAGYLGQEVSHLIAGESTMQRKYIRERDWIVRLAEHTFFLLPLIIMTCGRRRQCPLRLLVSRKAVLSTNLVSISQRNDLQAIREWVSREHPSLSQSTHWWQHDLAADVGEAFARLSHDRSIQAMIRRFHGTGYHVRPVLGMNELYVTGPAKTTSSDTVFYMPHVDGPWSVFPGARLYRCMLAASPNTEVTTHFPMSAVDYKEPEGYRLETGDATAFDFNRELHYITRQPDPGRTEPRVNLKLHFIAYPKNLGWYGAMLDRLTTQYDIRARELFLATINPNGAWAKIKARWVLAWTMIFEFAARFVGWTNIAYLCALAVASLSLNDWRPFVVGSSFVHYLIYAGTIREQTPVAFGEFKRNAMLFKGIAMAILFGLYLAAGSHSITSLAVVMAGFALATYSTNVLGISRTYFSAELGFEPRQHIDRFPYNVIPHPMIVGAMVGISGMLLNPAFCETYWLLAVAHLFAYVAILLQEKLSQSGDFHQPCSR